MWLYFDIFSDILIVCSLKAVFPKCRKYILHIYVYICIYTSVCVYIYIFRPKYFHDTEVRAIYMYEYIYEYVYIYIYVCMYIQA